MTVMALSARGRIRAMWNWGVIRVIRSSSRSGWPRGRLSGRSVRPPWPGAGSETEPAEPPRKQRRPPSRPSRPTSQGPRPPSSQGPRPPSRCRRHNPTRPRERAHTPRRGHAPPPLGGSQVPSAGHDGRDQQRAPYDLGGCLRGYLAGYEFGGPPEAINVVPMHRDVNLPVKGVDTFYAFEQKVREDPGNYRDIRVEVRYADPGAASPTGSLEGLDPASRVPEEFHVSWTDRRSAGREKVYPNEAIAESGAQ